MIYENIIQTQRKAKFMGSTAKCRNRFVGRILIHGMTGERFSGRQTLECMKQVTLDVWVRRSEEITRGQAKLTPIYGLMTKQKTFCFSIRIHTDSPGFPSDMLRPSVLVLMISRHVRYAILTLIILSMWLFSFCLCPFITILNSAASILRPPPLWFLLTILVILSFHTVGSVLAGSARLIRAALSTKIFWPL